jgi:hypothetical protein
VKREDGFVSSKLARFTDRVVSLAKTVVGEPDPAFEEREDGYADWVIVAIYGLREYLDHTYRRLLDVLHEMHGIVAKLDLAVADLPDWLNRVSWFDLCRGSRCSSGVGMGEPRRRLVIR